MLGCTGWLRQLQREKNKTMFWMFFCGRSFQITQFANWNTTFVVCRLCCFEDSRIRQSRSSEGHGPGSYQVSPQTVWGGQTCWMNTLRPTSYPGLDEYNDFSLFSWWFSERTPRNVLVHIDTCTPCTLLLFLGVCLVPWKKQNKTKQTTNQRLRALFFLNIDNYTESIWRAPWPATHT